MKNALKYVAITAMALLLSVEGFAQQNVYKGKIEFGIPRTSVRDGMFVIDMDVDLSNLKMHRQQLVMLTPVLRVRQGEENHTYIFAPTAINGKVRHKALQRSLKFNKNYFEYEPGLIILRENGKRQVLPLSLSVPYEQWMDHAELVFVEEVTGCSSCHVAYNEYTIPARSSIAAPAIPSAGIPAPGHQPPQFMLSMITPNTEDVKQRSETHSSSLNFVVGRHDIIRDYKNNRERLDMIDRIIGNVKSDKNVTLTELKVVGYASPEGYIDGNLGLSKRRALSFVRYMKTTHALPEYMVDFKWMGEDWPGLKHLVAQSQMPERHDVVDIIETYANVGQRKAKLRTINHGDTYRYLLGVYYPGLRRDEYTISYTVRNFDVAEAQEIIKTRPHQLSLSEMFLVASTYPVGSAEFKEVFTTAVRYFPHDPAAATNAGAIELENNSIDAAIARLTGIERPEAWNNLGVAYAKKGDYGLAWQYFAKAAQAGDHAAEGNLAKLRAWTGR